jgi:hypothetical protein
MYLETLVEHSDYIAECIYTNCEYNINTFIEQLIILITNDIIIHFDANRFFFSEYESRLASKLYFRIDMKHTPPNVLVAIRDIIYNNKMKQSIKNKNYSIHFRMFTERYIIEDVEESLRCAIVLNACIVSGKALEIFYSLRQCRRDCEQRNIRARYEIVLKFLRDRFVF